MIRIISLLALTSFLSPVFAASVPVEAFARLPLLADPDVSPDGSRIAVLLANEEGYYDVAVTEFGKNDFVIVARMKNPRDRIVDVRWANDRRLLVAAAFPQDAGALTYYVSKLYSVDVTDGDMIELRPRHFETSWGGRYSSNGNVISVLRNDSEHILVEWMTQKDEHSGVYKVNVTDGDYEKLFVNAYGIDAWYADDAGNVNLGLSWSDEEGKDDVVTFWVPEQGGASWRQVKTVKLTQDAQFSPLMLDRKSGLLYVLSTHEYDTSTLYAYDVKKGEFVEELWHVEGYDIESLLVRDGRAVGVTWTEDFVRQHYFDEADSGLLQLVEQTFRGAEVSIASTDSSRQRVVVYAIRDDMPGRYFLLDLEAGKATPWFSEYPELAGVKLAHQQPFSYKSRDGLRMNGYITLPPDVSAGEKPPLVVLPHGGPWSRDYRYFDYFAQFFANRGYAVVQMNFRGSSGFGAAFERLGDKQWGQAMQQDVLDAIQYVKDNGIADTDRMCIVGGSYGGYVALTAAVQTPSLFDCVVSIAGVSDLVAHIEDKTRIFGGEQFHLQYIGDPDDEEDRKMLEAYSPINHVERLEAPVLLFHGTNDSRVAHSQSEDFYNRAKYLGKNVRYIKVDEATHFLDDGATRLKAFQAMDAFLQQHLH